MDKPEKCLTPLIILPISDKIERLSELGLAPAEIAEVLGKKTNYVTATISQNMKKKKKGRKK